MTNGTENSRNFQISGKKDNTLSIYLILYRKFRLNRSRPLNLGTTSGSNFDLSMETMVPWRSSQKGHEETPRTNLFACGQLAAVPPVPGNFCYPAFCSNVQCVHGVLAAGLPKFQKRAGLKENLSSKRDTASIESKMRWKDRYSSLLWFFEGIGTPGMISTDLFRFTLRAWLKVLFGLSLHLTVETRMTLTHHNRSESAWKAGKWQRIQEETG